MFCIDPVGNASLNVGMSGEKKTKSQRSHSQAMQFKGDVCINNITPDEKLPHWSL